MTHDERDRFDRLFDGVLTTLPGQAREVIERVPVILEDRPGPEVLREFGIDPDEPEAHLELCGLHTGVMDTELQIEMDGVLPSQIHLFREAIVCHAGGWDDPEEIRRQIAITLLHEIGHQIGLDEDDLDALGYG
ncbi:MAG: metallopeptidase family protein [Phycisphaerales bacterium JB040]